MNCIIKDGRLFDPSCTLNAVAALEISDGRIVPDGTLDKGKTLTVDAAGCLVLPGLIDFHVHVFEGGSQFGFNPDLLFSSGVTGVVDAGTAGTANYLAFHRAVTTRSMHVNSLLNISPMGQLGSGLNENMDPAFMNEQEIANMISRYKDKIIGIKVRVSKGIVGRFGAAPLKKALEVGQDLGVFICVHATDPCIPTEKIATLLRSGDVFCHVYHGKGDTILNDDGKVKPAVLHARERGVLFDCANGRSNFSFRTAKQAMSQTFYPDIISTDLTAATVNTGSKVRNLPFVMSKYLSMGMPLEKVISAVTINPLRLIDPKTKSGLLKIGCKANISILKQIPRKERFYDSNGDFLEGSTMLIPEMTIVGGNIMFDNNCLPRYQSF